jgi:hypothetical protein
MRKTLTCEEAMVVMATSCLAAALVIAQEQMMLHVGAYVRLHGLNKASLNGHEGRIVQRGKNKAEVELAGTKRVIKVHCKNLTVMPTFTTSRCKLMKHTVTEISFQPEPVWSWPQILTGSYYNFLKVQRTATADDIRSAFRKLSVTLHPDKNPNNAEKATQLFQQVLEAYECLSDSMKRMRYDQQLDAETRRHRTASAFGQRAWPWY